MKTLFLLLLFVPRHYSQWRHIRMAFWDEIGKYGAYAIYAGTYKPRPREALPLWLMHFNDHNITRYYKGPFDRPPSSVTYQREVDKTVYADGRIAYN